MKPTVEVKTETHSYTIPPPKPTRSQVTAGVATPVLLTLRLTVAVLIAWWIAAPPLSFGANDLRIEGRWNRFGPEIVPDDKERTTLGPNFTTLDDNAVLPPDEVSFEWEYNPVLPFDGPLVPSDVTVTTGFGGLNSQPGNIFVNEGIIGNSDHHLTIQAHNDLNVSHFIHNSGHGAIVLKAGGGMLSSDSLSTRGGAITLTAMGASGISLVGSVVNDDPFNISDVPPNGDIEISALEGPVNTSATYVSASAPHGPAGDISVFAKGVLTTGSLLATSESCLNGGNISLQSWQAVNTLAGLIDVSGHGEIIQGVGSANVLIETDSTVVTGAIRATSDYGFGGSVRIRGDFGVASLGGINTSSFSANGHKAGDVFLTNALPSDPARVSTISGGDITTTSLTGRGGNVSLYSDQDQCTIVVTGIVCTDSAGSASAGSSGGRIHLSTAGASVDTSSGKLSTGGHVYSAAHGGEVYLYGPRGVTAGTIWSKSSQGNGGPVSIGTHLGGILLAGQVDSSSSALGGQSGGEVRLFAYGTGPVDGIRTSMVDTSAASGPGGNLFVDTFGPAGIRVEGWLVTDSGGAAIDGVSGGAISLSARNGGIDATDQTLSTGGVRYLSANAGVISLHAGGGGITAENLVATSATGEGGRVSLEAVGEVTVASIRADYADIQTGTQNIQAGTQITVGSITNGTFVFVAPAIRIREAAIGRNEFSVLVGPHVTIDDLTANGYVSFEAHWDGRMTFGGVVELTNVAGTNADPDEAGLYFKLWPGGSVTMTGEVTYKCPTYVTSGTFLVVGDHSAATGTVEILEEGVLAGTGTVGGSVAAYGTVAPGSAGVGDLTVGPATFIGTWYEWVLTVGNLVVEIDGSVADKLVVNGDLSLVDSPPLSVAVLTGGFTQESYTIVECRGGTISGTFSVPDGYRVVYTPTQAKLMRGATERPQIAALTPPEVASGSSAFTLAVEGNSFAPGAVVQWDGASLDTTFVSSSQLTAAVTSTPVTSDFQTALITVKNPDDIISSPVVFTVTAANIVRTHSAVAEAGQNVTVSTAPATAGDTTGIHAILNNSGDPSPVTITTAIYNTNPLSSTAFGVAGKYMDLRVTGADDADALTAWFYYPVDAVEGQSSPRLKYYNGSAWANVMSSGDSNPGKDTNDDLNGTVSGGRFTVIFDNTSTPKITKLSGTVFAIGATGPQLTGLGPAQVWLGLKNSDDVGTKFDLLAEMFRNGEPIGSGQLNSVPGGSSGFNNAVLRTIDLALPAPVALASGDALSLKLSVRIAANVSGHRSGTARLWFNDAAANSRFAASVDGVSSDYFLRSNSLLGTSAGPGPKKTIDVSVNKAVGGNPFKPFGTWTKQF